MKPSSGNICLVTAVGFTLFAGVALAQSVDPKQPATRSISVVATPPSAVDGAKGAGDTAKDTAPTAAPLPPLPTELSTQGDPARDKSSIVVTPAPSADAAKNVTAVGAPPPPIANVSKETDGAVLVPAPGAGKDKVVIVPAKPGPPPKVVGHPKTADVNLGPAPVRSHQRHYDHDDHYEHERYSGDYGHHRHHEDTCEDGY